MRYDGGNPYAGSYGLELFENNTLSTSLATINAAESFAGFGVMNPLNTTTLGPTANGWALEKVFTGQTTAGYYISLGGVTMADAPAGGNVILGLAAWNNGSALNLSDVGLHLGVIAFPQAVVNASAVPPPPPADISAGWLTVNQGLVMTPAVPEPGTLALAGLGVAALLILRRRK